MRFLDLVVDITPQVGFMVPQFGKAESKIFHVKYSVLRYMIRNVMKSLRFIK